MASNQWEWGVDANTVPAHMVLASEGVRVAFEDTAEELKDQLVDKGPQDSGDLARSWYIVNNGLNNGLKFGDEEVHEYRVASGDIAASATSTGSGRFNTGGSTGPIKPTKARALVFHWKRIGQDTVWKGDLNSVRHMGEFYRWAVANGLQPFFVWPKGQAPNAYVGMSIAETLMRFPEIGERAFRKVQAT